MPSERSEKQKQASRINGAKSKGPIALRGKAIASRNRTTRGLLARTIVLDAESAARFDQLRLELHKALQPRNAAETALVENMAAARWRQVRAMSLRKATLDRDFARNVTAGPTSLRAAHAPTERASADSHRTLLNYEMAFENQLSRALLCWRQLRDVLPQSPNWETPYTLSDSTLGVWRENASGTGIRTQEVVDITKKCSGSIANEPEPREEAKTMGAGNAAE